MTAQSLERAGYSPRETYESHGFSSATFWKYVRLGLIKTIHIGGRTIVPADEYRRIGTEGISGPSRRGAYRPRKTEGAAQ